MTPQKLTNKINNEKKKEKRKKKRKKTCFVCFQTNSTFSNDIYQKNKKKKKKQYQTHKYIQKIGKTVKNKASFLLFSETQLIFELVNDLPIIYFKGVNLRP
jgi:hypothetical protein